MYTEAFGPIPFFFYSTNTETDHFL